MKLKTSLPAALKYQAVVIESAAREAGLDFFDVIFEILDARDVNGIASYGGFPVRYPSWRFGMEYERLDKGYTWGFSKIYELVINNDPTYAYLVRSNSLLEQKLVMAHVFGHADFFKHNVWFAPTNRHMMETMADHATRIRRIMDVVGQERVERFLDLALSLETLIDPYQPLRDMGASTAERLNVPLSERARRSLDALTSSAIDEAERVVEPAAWEGQLPSYDLLGFLSEHAPLESWEREILHILRREAYYFAPQRMTKIMNEGWASFWHSRLLTGGLLDASEILDFADTHSGATSSSGGINPYKLGIELFRYAEERKEDIWLLRRAHNDVSLIDYLVDEEFCERCLRPMLMPPKRVMRMTPAGPEWSVEEGEKPPWTELKARVLRDLAWGGLPQIQLIGVDQKGDGELNLVHHHDGRDLQFEQTSATLNNLSEIWKGPAELMSLEEGEGRLLVSRDGEVSSLDSTEARDRCGSDSDAA